MRSSRLLALIALALLLGACSENDPYEPEGDPVYENHYVPTEYATISEAAAAALPGDTLRLLAGTYEEDVDLPTGVQLLGVGWEHVTIRGGLSVTGSGREVRVEGFSISNASGSGILLEDCSLRLTRYLVDSCAEAGIEIVGDGGLLVQDCQITANAAGVLLRNATEAAHYEDFDHPDGRAPKIIHCNLFDNGGSAGDAVNILFENVAAPDTIGVSNNYWGIVPVDPNEIENTIYDHKDGDPHGNGLADTYDDNLLASPLILDVP